MSSKIAALLAERAAAEAEAALVEATRQAKHLAEMQEKAKHTLDTFLGEYADELLPMIYSQSEDRDRNGVLINWWMGSNEMQLAPLMIIWTEAWTGSLAFRVDIGGAGWRDLSSHSSVEQVLAAMHEYYPQYKAQKDKLLAEKAKIEAAKREELISNLCWPANWTSLYSEDRVMERYRQLVALGMQDVADQKLASYRAAVAEEQRRVQVATARKAAYEKAKAEYEEKREAWWDACKAWAEQETARLWQPWTLYKVRYTPWHAQASVEDVERFPIETIYVLEAPEDIVNGANPVAKVTRVTWEGEIVDEFAIATFLDSTPIVYGALPDVGETLDFHRHYWAGGFVVNVPAFVLEEPIAAPVAPQPPTCDEDGDLW